MKALFDQNTTVSISGDIKLTQDETGYFLEVGKSGGTVKLTGEKGQLGGVTWASDKFFVIPLTNHADHSYYFSYKFYGETGDFAMADFATIPHMDVEVSFHLSFLNLETVFMPRTPGRLKNMMHGVPMRAEEVVAVELCIPPSSTEATLNYRWPYLSDERPEVTENLAPQLDDLGQWVTKTWEGKTPSKEVLIQELNEALNEELPAYEAQRSQYGGELALKREGTGFFRIHEEDGKYWFCDPEGYLMFSGGIDMIVPQEFSPTEGLEMLFDALPPKAGKYEEAWRDTNISHVSTNLIEAFGEEWQTKWAKLTQKRLKSWGFNSIGNWASADFVKTAGISYVFQGSFPKTEQCLFRSMPDVFSKEYRESAKACAQYLLDYRDDPYMIGYFMRNEPDWAFGAYNIAGIMLEKEEAFATKEVFISEMYRKYKTIEAFNEAWHMALTSFEEIKKPMEKPWTFSASAKEDLENFTRRIIREYVRVPAEAYRQVDPNHLNLGLRWGWLATDDLVEGCEYCDVFSINCYQECPDKAYFDRIYGMTKKPILIGEFQVGSLNVGLMANGMYGVPSQEERGVFYRYYMEKAAELPYMIGAHYFQWNDQPVLGRFDGENLNLGLVDVCNKPYHGFIEGIKVTNANLAKVHQGEMPATTTRSKLVPKEGF